MKKNAVNFLMLMFAIMINIFAINAQTKSPSVEVVDENNYKQNLILKKLDIDIKVVGNLAVTTMDMTFTNDFPAKSRALEGTLIFPLAEGQSVNRLAMDFSGIMREGVIVEKEKGRVVFEEIERRGVDPALLEMTTSNNYKLRIFPILPSKERRIIIAYEEILKSNADGMTYNLPLEFEKEIKEFTLRANVFNEVQPITNGKTLFKKDDNSYNLEYEYSDYKAKEMFSFSVPTPENQKSILCEMIDGERYFVVNRSIEIPKAEKLTANKITILWDCSHSSNKRDIKKEIELLSEYFKANPNCTVEFITFNYKIKSRKEYQIANSNADEIIKAIEKVRYDGGSNFDCIDLSRSKSDMIMVFTDGISSLGNSKILESKAPINVINSNLSANNFYLNDIANTSGGSYVNLLNCEVEQAVEVLTEKQYRLISIENNAAETEEIFPRSTQNLIQDLSIAGKMKSDIAKIKLNYGYGNKVKRSETIFIDANENKVESGVLSRIWAKKKLDNLAENPKKNKAKMLSIGQKYNIVSQNTSLIVLEEAYHYFQYKIEPPKSDSALYKEYKQIYKALNYYEERQKKYNDNKLSNLVKKFENRKLWYNTDFYELMKSKPKDEDSIPDMDDFVMVDKSNKELLPNTDKIHLSPYNSNAKYYIEMKELNGESLIEKYYENKLNYLNNTGFYIDIAELFSEKSEFEKAEEVITNIAELGDENQEFMRLIGYKLQKIKRYELAKQIFEYIVEIRAEEPQSFRDLAIINEEIGNYQEAADLYYKVALGKWHWRFTGIEMTALTELNTLIAKHYKEIITEKYDSRLIYAMPLDLRVVLRWDLDNTDIDLWVTDPRHERCYYGKRQTKIGGLFPADFTGGNGPEEFLLKTAMKGKYTIECNYFGSRATKLTGGTTIFLDIYTNYGKPNEKKETKMMRLKDVKGTIKIGEIKIE